MSAAGPGDAWAVGWYFGSTVIEPLAARWDGTSLSLVAAPGAAGRSSFFLAVAALAGDEAWAAGYVDEPGGRRTLVECWDGGAWSEVPSPSPGNDVLFAVDALRCGDAWTGGEHTAPTGDETLLERHPASAAKPATVAFNSLRAVDAAGSVDLSWLLGSGSGGFNLHRSLDKSEIPGLWSKPASLVGSTPSLAFTDPGFAPAPGTCGHYQVYGRDPCTGASAP